MSNFYHAICRSLPSVEGCERSLMRSISAAITQFLLPSDPLKAESFVIRYLRYDKLSLSELFGVVFQRYLA
jgi:hypothetical protein